MNGVSLFANVGIAETYIKNHNIKIVVANELMENRAKFYKESHPYTEVICGNIANKDIYGKVLNIAKENKCEFLIATPPCQGMSVAGKMKENDPRNSLIKYVVEFAKDLNPTHIIIENVIGILKAFVWVNGEKKRIVDYITDVTIR